MSRAGDQKALTGRLDDVLRRLDELFRLNVSVRTEVAGRPREARRPDYPVTALQQLGWNAVTHRGYEGTHAPTRTDFRRLARAVAERAGVPFADHGTAAARV